VSVTVETGEVFGFLGPNGAGKTTTIRTLTGLSAPTAGRAAVLGRDIRSAEEMAEVKRRGGVVPEASNLYDELPALDNLVFTAQLYGLPRRRWRPRAEELLELFGLHERRKDLFRTFSRGMKRALTIAAALVHEPELLFLDEPTVGLDAGAARSLRRTIKDLREAGVTIFLTTHYLDEADVLCDRLAVIVRGRIVQTGTPGELKALVQEEPTVEAGLGAGPGSPAGAEALSRIRREVEARLPASRAVPVGSGKLRVYGVSHPAMVRALLDAAEGTGIEILEMRTVTPSLEDAFVRIAGLDPEVMAREKGVGSRR